MVKSLCWIKYLFLSAVMSYTGSINSFATDPGSFMHNGAGARALGMGNAYTAVEGDIYSSYFNPAGLASMEDRQLSISFRYLTMDRIYRYFAYGSRIGPDADFAIQWINAGYDETMGRDLNGNPTGTIQDSRNSFAVSFSRYLNRYISIGFNTKLTYWRLSDDTAKAFGFDAGLIYRPTQTVTAGIALKDISSAFAWRSEQWSANLSDGQPIEKRDKFPLYVTAGASWRTLDDRLLLALSLDHIQDQPLWMNLGAEYGYSDRFKLRTGVYNLNSSDEKSIKYTAGFTLGVNSLINLDYAFAWSSLPDDNMHELSLVLNYGK